jgi:hypothetical protein
MERLVKTYYKDLGNHLETPFPEFYRYVANLPYRRDPKDIETISRPKFALLARWPWRDCDDKAILIGAWLYAHGVPFRFIAVSKRPDKVLHHVLIEANRAGKNELIDATLKTNNLGMVENYTKSQPIGNWIMPELRTLEGPLMGWPKLPKVKSIKRIAGKVGKGAVKVYTAPIKGAVKVARVTSRVIGRNVPGPIKTAIGKAVRATVGNRTITPALKAVILPSATAAALAVPGAQAFAPGVPIVVNVALDEMIKAAKKKAAKVLPGATSTTAPKLTTARKMEIKQALTKQKQERRAAKLAPAPAAAAAQAPAPAVEMVETSNKTPLIIAGAAGLAALLFLTRKKS